MPNTTIDSIAPTTEKVPNGHPNEDDVLLNQEDDAIAPGDEEEDEEEEEESSKPPKSDDDDEEEEEDEGEEDEGDEEEEGKKPNIPFDRPTVKELKAAFPDIFTKFPSLKEAYFREIEFTKLFPTVEEAKEAFTDNQAFEVLQDSALAGDSALLLKSVEETDPKAFQLFAATFLPNLYKQNQEVYTAAVTPLFENLVRAAYKSSEENVKNSAVNIAIYLWGEDVAEDICQGKKTFSQQEKLTADQKKAQTDRETQNSQKFRETFGTVETEINESLKTLILRDFDPEKAFPKFVRNQLVDTVIQRIHQQLTTDKGHASVMQARWKRAKSNGYTNEDRSKIVSTFLARAKSLIPATSDKVRRLAMGKQERNSEREIKRGTPTKKEALGGRPSGGGKRSGKEAPDYRKMSDAEILAMD